jgi:hypothetical protein
MHDLTLFSAFAAAVIGPPVPSGRRVDALDTSR